MRLPPLRSWALPILGALAACAIAAFLFLRPGPSLAKRESQAIDALNLSMAAQAAYSLHMAKEGGPPKFAENIADLYYTERDGSPLAFIPKMMADAKSPETACHGYYYTSLTTDAKGPIDPLVDFAICATPIDERCSILIVRGTYYKGGSGIIWKSTRNGPTDTHAPIQAFPDIPSDRRWLVVYSGFYIVFEGPGVVRGDGALHPSGPWLDRNRLLTASELEEWLRKTKEQFFPSQ